MSYRDWESDFKLCNMTNWIEKEYTAVHVLYMYRIRPNYRPCPHNRPPWLFTLFSLIIAHLTIFFLTFYLIFTYYRLLNDLLALVEENKFT